MSGPKMKSDKAKTSLKLESHQVLLRPLVTEKGMHRSERYNQYSFEISVLATKDDVRRAVEELFDVQVVPRSRRTVVCGPYPKEDGQSSVWVVPRHDQVDELSQSPARRGVSRRPRRSERD